MEREPIVQIDRERGDTFECPKPGCKARVVWGEGSACPKHTKWMAAETLDFEAGVPGEIETMEGSVDA